MVSTQKWEFNYNYHLHYYQVSIAPNLSTPPHKGAAQLAGFSVWQGESSQFHRGRANSRGEEEGLCCLNILCRGTAGTGEPRRGVGEELRGEDAAPLSMAGSRAQVHLQDHTKGQPNLTIYISSSLLQKKRENKCIYPSQFSPQRAHAHIQIRNTCIFYHQSLA